MAIICVFRRPFVGRQRDAIPGQLRVSTAGLISSTLRFSRSCVRARRIYWRASASLISHVDSKQEVEMTIVEAILFWFMAYTAGDAAAVHRCCLDNPPYEVES
jgi:hypothetical protein